MSENFVILTESHFGVSPPRPVFFEELDLLGFDEWMDYPKSEEPLLWAIGRNYYYKGEVVAKTKGGNFFEKPKIEFLNDQKIEIEPIDIKKLVKRNKDKLFVLENEAMDFIQGVYNIYKNDSIFTVSYSGGKDSQVILDLVTRVISPDDLIVIFSDTTLENTFTYENVQRTKEEYLNKYPKLKFKTAKPPKSAAELIKYAGLPSRFKRWCTDALKTAPFKNLLKEILKDYSEVIVFEGVRSEESSRRSTYSRIEGEVKHSAIINARPILDWNITEVYLYLFYRGLNLNQAYRWGLSRVGCILCPYSSVWTEFINYNLEKESLEHYISFIKNYANIRGVPEKNVKKFIANGEWKKRAGGLGLDLESNIIISEDSDKIKGTVTNPRESFLEWCKVLGDRNYRENKGEFSGEIRIDDSKVDFKIKNSNSEKQIIEVWNIENPTVKSKIRKILYKTTFCVNCGLCQAECPNFALETVDKLNVNSNFCKKCHKCLYFSKNGCIIAASVYNSVGGIKMKKRTGGIDKYSTFGLRQEWLNDFFVLGDEWLSNNTLGPKQVPAVLRWLIDAELIDEKKKVSTDIGNYLREIYKKDKSSAWLIIWNNMYYNSMVVNWYLNKIPWGKITDKNELKEKMGLDYPEYSKGTIGNPIDAMVNMFDNSPLGDKLGIGVIEKKGRTIKSIHKLGVSDINPYVVAYSLYKLAENTSRRNFTVSELFENDFEGGPYKIFGLSKNNFERILRGLQEGQRILSADLVADLDNIRLREDLTSLDIIKTYCEGL